MSSGLAGKSVLVTGGSGSIGSEIVVQALRQDVRRVVVFSRDEVKHFMMRKRFSDERLQTIVGDVRDIRSTEQIFVNFDIDIIYHAAAMKHVVMCEDFPMESVHTNVVGTQNIVDLALKYRVPRMIAISTDKAAYPTNVMGACKFIAERMATNANRLSKEGQVFSCVRFGNVANSRGSVIPVFIEDLLNRRPLQVSDPAVTRFTMEIHEAVALVIKATELARGGETFILKMKAFRLGDLVEVMTKRIAPKLSIPEGNVESMMTGLVAGEKLHEDLINDTESTRLYELEDMYALLPAGYPTGSPMTAHKASLRRYNSSDAELISPDELENIVLKYVQTRPEAA